MTIFETIFLAAKYNIANIDMGGVSALGCQNCGVLNVEKCQELAMLSTLLESDITIATPRFAIAVIPFKVYFVVISDIVITFYIDKKVKKMGKWGNKFQMQLGVPVIFRVYEEGV